VRPLLSIENQSRKKANASANIRAETASTWRRPCWIKQHQLGKYPNLKALRAALPICISIKQCTGRDKEARLILATVPCPPEAFSLFSSAKTSISSLPFASWRRIVRRKPAWTPHPDQQSRIL
jgi:hypothetical protein